MNAAGKEGSDPSLSIVIAVEDYADDPGAWLEALGSQAIAEYEVVIVDAERGGDYGPSLKHFLARYDGSASFSYLRIPVASRARALNHGIDHSSNALILFLGSDFVPNLSLAATHLRFHATHPQATAVGIGSALVPPRFSSRLAQWLESSGRLFGVPFSVDMTAIPGDFFYMGNASVKRAFLQAAGRFDESFPHHAWDDYEMGLRLRDAGMTAHFLPAATAIHDHRITLRARSARIRQAGESAWIFETRRPGPYSWTPVVERPPWRHTLGAVARLGRFALGRDPRDLERFYARVLDGAFASGYKTAGAGLPLWG